MHASRNAALQAHSQNCGPPAYSGNRHTHASLASGCKDILPGFVRRRGSQAVHFHRTPSTHRSGVFAVQAWGVMEARLGNTAAARRVFERGAARAPPHPPLLSAWARMEVCHTVTVPKDQGSATSVGSLDLSTSTDLASRTSSRTCLLMSADSVCNILLIAQLSRGNGSSWSCMQAGAGHYSCQECWLDHMHFGKWCSQHSSGVRMLAFTTVCKDLIVAAICIHRHRL